MTTAKALEQRLAAWRSFRSIARAARTLAATQVITWSTRAKQAARHLAWTQALAEHVDDGRGLPMAERVPVELAIGTDLGLCGRMNAALAEALRASIEREPGDERRPLIIVGSRLVDEIEGDPPEMVLPAASSLEAVEGSSRQIATALEAVAPVEGLALSISLIATTTNDGQPIPARWRGAGDSAGPGPALPELGRARSALRAPITRLSALEASRASVAALLLRARISHALCVATASEASARLFTMSRAYEASDRSIRRQELDLRKLQQEAITQDMLEVRAGRRSAQAGLR